MTSTLDAATVQLPRWQVGNNPQHLLITVLGDFWIGRPEYLPSAALVRLLEDLGSSTESGRAALSRLARRGVISARRVGRTTRYRFATAAARLAVDVQRDIVDFGGTQEPWTGSWVLCAFSVPESRRDSRTSIRSQLRALGFGPLYDGLWVSASAPPDRVRQVFDEQGIDAFHVFEATALPASPRSVADAAWDLDSLRDQYLGFIDRWSTTVDHLRDGSLAPREAFIVRTLISDEYRQFYRIDPCLPASALPADWPSSETRELFVEVRDRLAPLAELRVRQVVEEYEPELAALVHAHSTDAMRAGIAGVTGCESCLPYEDWPAESG